jgi:hypothetical protein
MNHNPTVKLMARMFPSPVHAVYQPRFSCKCARGQCSWGPIGTDLLSQCVPVTRPNTPAQRTPVEQWPHQRTMTYQLATRGRRTRSQRVATDCCNALLGGLRQRHGGGPPALPFTPESAEAFHERDTPDREFDGRMRAKICRIFDICIQPMKVRRAKNQHAGDQVCGPPSPSMERPARVHRVVGYASSVGQACQRFS